MSYKCSLCGKKVVSGNKVSHSNRHTRKKWLPNLQNVRAVISGVTQRVKVCTACIKSNKVIKAPKRNYKPTQA